MSVRRFLLAGMLGFLLLSIAVIFLVNRYQSFVEVGELYDTQLAQTCRILQGFVDQPVNEIDFEHLNRALLNVTQHYSEGDIRDDTRSDEGHQYEYKFAVQIWDKNLHLVVKSPTAPTYAISDFKDGYSIKKIDTFKWHIFTHHLDSNGYWVMVAERGDVREELINELTYSSLIGPISGLLFLVAGVILVAAKGLQPLLSLLQQIRERHIDNLEPLALANVPNDLKPLGHAVNTLMERVSQGVERERLFLGDIAHELRTPLAAVRLNAQNGLRSLDPTGTQKFFTKIIQGVDRSIRLIEQLLTLARLDPRALGERENCLLGDISQDAINILSNQQHLNSAAKISLDKSLFTARLYAYPDLLNALLRNLIENACHYTPESGNILVIAENNADATITLNVIDNGPGVSNLQLQSLGKRFFREHPADRMGNGLGLSIVTRIAQLHDAQVSFSNAVPHGLKVSIIFPSTAIICSS